MAKKAAKKEQPEKKKAPKRTEAVYSVLAFITFVAMVVGCVLLYMDFDEYGQKGPPKDPVPQLTKLGDDSTPARTN